MATAREWGDAYLEQARADLRGAERVGAEASSVFAMLLQMTFEKLAKSALLRSEAVTIEWAQHTHAAATRMVRVLRNQRGMMAPLGGPHAWEDVLLVVAELERAHPQLARARGGGPQLEYPWEHATGVAQWPEVHLAIARRLADPETTIGGRVLRFARLLADRFDQVFD
jgi:hypothetical protein